jgi:hypothetical protein
MTTDRNRGLSADLGPTDRPKNRAQDLEAPENPQHWTH